MHIDGEEQKGLHLPGLNDSFSSTVKSLMANTLGLLEAARPAMWLKPLFLMLVAGAYALKDIPNLGRLTVGFIIVGPLLWGGLYMLNAVTDANDDRIHPVKRLRPFASGRISVRLGRVTSLVLILTALLWSLTFGSFFAFCVWLMCLKQLAYTLPPFRLKRLFLWDIVSGSLFNSTLRFAAGWALFSKNITMPLLLLLFAEALQLAGFLVNRLFTDYENGIERKLGYTSTTTTISATSIQHLIIGCWGVGLAAFSLLCLNSLLKFHVSLLGTFPIQAFLVFVLLVAALPFFGHAMARARQFTPREATAYYDLPLLWVFLLSVLLSIIIKWFG